jgi:hypothetical protein
MTAESHTKLELGYSIYKNKYKINRKNVIFVVVVPCISINIKVFCDQQMHTLLT